MLTRKRGSSDIMAAATWRASSVWPVAIRLPMSGRMFAVKRGALAKVLRPQRIAVSWSPLK